MDPYSEPDPYFKADPFLEPDPYPELYPNQELDPVPDYQIYLKMSEFPRKQF
jgi:hypothetical protein